VITRGWSPSTSTAPSNLEANQPILRRQPGWLQLDILSLDVTTKRLKSALSDARPARIPTLIHPVLQKSCETVLEKPQAML
jgi:hypothetical protein